MQIPVATVYNLHDAPVCGDLLNDGAHVRVTSAGPSITMARIFKRGSQELWGIAAMGGIHDADAHASGIANLYWLVDIRQHENQLTGHLCTIALLYPDDYHAAQHLIQSFRTLPPLPLMST